MEFDRNGVPTGYFIRPINYGQYLLDVDAEVEKMAKAYGMEPDKLKEYMGDAEKESMKKDIAITKAVDLIMDNIKERAKAKRKTDAAKEESTEE